jgi:hypothetical protein
VRVLAEQKHAEAEMAIDILARQEGARARKTGEPFEEALKTVLETEAGQQLGELRDGPYRDERAQDWQEDMMRERVRERKQERVEEQKRAKQAAASMPGCWANLCRGSRRQHCGDWPPRIKDRPKRGWWR